MQRGFVIIVSVLSFFVFLTVSTDAVTLKKDINKVTIDDLIQVKGIGPKKAELILNFLQKHGRISELDELLQVKGIGPKILDKIKEHFYVKDSGKGDIGIKGEDSTYINIKNMEREGKQHP